MKSEIMSKISDALRRVLNLNEVDIHPDSKLKEDLGLDSMTSLTFLMTLEENIDGFVVNPDTLEMTDLDTVSSITNYVEKQLNNQVSFLTNENKVDNIEEKLYV